MDIDLLSKMVRETILDHDAVTLPGIGSFMAEIVPSSFSDKGYTINPPYRRLFFSRREEGDTLLADLYAESNKIPVPSAERIVTEFLAELKDVLKEKKTVVFPGLGRLRATKENNFFFIADEDLDIYPAGFGLKPVSLKTHEETEDEVSAAVAGLASILNEPAQPAVPAQPEPAEQPAQPTSEPVQPAPQPAQPAPAPAQPATAPTVAAVSPAPEPAAQPVQSAEPAQPEPAEQSAQPTSEPVQPAPQLAQPAPAKPETAEPALQPAPAPAKPEPAEQPAQPAPQPAEPIQPVAPALHPAEPAQPVAPAPHPAEPAQPAAAPTVAAVPPAPEPAPKPTPVREPVDPWLGVRKIERKPWPAWKVALTVLGSVLALAVVLLLVYMVVARLAPDFVDRFLYSAEELEFVQKAF